MRFHVDFFFISDLEIGGSICLFFGLEAQDLFVLLPFSLMGIGPTINALARRVVDGFSFEVPFL